MQIFFVYLRYKLEYTKHTQSLTHTNTHTHAAHSPRSMHIHIQTSTRMHAVKKLVTYTYALIHTHTYTPADTRFKRQQAFYRFGREKCTQSLGCAQTGCFHSYLAQKFPDHELVCLRQVSAHVCVDVRTCMYGCIYVYMCVHT